MKKNLTKILNTNDYSGMSCDSAMHLEYENLGIFSNQVSLKDTVDIIKSSSCYDLLSDIYDNICDYALYESDTHGISHSERVMLYGYFIGNYLNLSKEEMKLLLYGCIYHDIGRSNDLEDTLHGYYSSEMVKSLPLNLTDEEIRILKVMMILHSCDDSRIDELGFLYGVMDKEQLKKLCFILKDADALDRVRLKCNDLNPDFLRYDISKRLILSACELNDYYDKCFLTSNVRCRV